MDIEQVARVVELVDNSQLHEVTIANSVQAITVVNNLDRQHITSCVKEFPTPKSEDRSSEYSQVYSPYVGRVYLSQDDCADNLVNEGDHIEEGQTICFIEELTKLLPVISNKKGTIGSILVESGQNIEYGQPILELKVSTQSK